MNPLYMLNPSQSSAEIEDSNSRACEATCAQQILVSLDALIKSQYEQARPLVISLKAFLERSSLEIDPLESELTEMFCDLSDGLDRFQMEPSVIAQFAVFIADYGVENDNL